MTHHHPGPAMAKPAKPSEPPQTKAAADKAKQPPPPRDTDDDYEDGDIATPKRDRYGSDDEPL
ncbi:hypothetical protein EAS56_01930 [Bradyrhizobium guangzhouense]|uniref:Uncharacterized protein n=2 Tax=Bradyrhizobium guangzhouense TaxID=1325095 RepID=A0AAE5X6Z5_9BRAD|nr:hypothetical protein XH91_33365 [Bradyrhizobium guangzhouense]RXH17859.1 hypothetical protein EAS56_01930 [Bradyrhizobium guangzhouense]